MLITMTPMKENSMRIDNGWIQCNQICTNKNDCVAQVKNTTRTFLPSIILKHHYINKNRSQIIIMCENYNQITEKE